MDVREAAVVEDAEVPGQWFQPGFVAGCGDGCVCFDSCPVREDDASPLKGFDAGRDLDLAGSDRVDDLLIHDRGCLAVASQPAEDSFRRWCQTVLAEVTDGQPAYQARLGIGDPGRESQRRDCLEIAGKPC